MTEWEQDCIREYGKRLTGDYAHWCPEWDGLPVDETCVEFFACASCFPGDKRAKALAGKWSDKVAADAKGVDWTVAFESDKQDGDRA